MSYFITDAGNVVTISRRENGHIWLDRVARIIDGESEDVTPHPWANVSQEYFDELVRKVWVPAVKLIGGNYVSEDAFIAGNAWRYES